MTSVENLDVFKLTHSIVLKVYEITRKFPKEELFGLVSQIRRAAASINCNLAEGGARLTMGERRQFFGISRGSAAEVKYQLLLSKDLKYISIQEFESLLKDLERVSQMITGLIKRNKNQ